MTYILIFAWMLTTEKPRIEVVALFDDRAACQHMAERIAAGRPGFSCIGAR